MLDSRNLSRTHLKSSMKILLFNARSLYDLGRLDRFKELIDFLQVDYDVIVVTESWITESLKSLYNLNGYNATHSCRGEAAHGGVVVYHKKGFTVTDTKVIFEKCANIVQINLSIHHSTTVNVIAVYHPPNLPVPEENRFLDIIDELLDENGSKKCILLGDLNFDPRQSDEKVKLFLEMLDSYSLCICNSIPTREASKRMLDYVCTNIYEERFHTILTCPLTKEDLFYSDHSLVTMFIELEFSPLKSIATAKKTLNHQKIESELQWRFHENILSLFTGANEMCEYIVTSILNLIERNQTESKLYCKHGRVCEWMSKHLDNLIKSKDELRRKARSSPTPRNKAALNKITNKVNKEKKKAQSDYQNGLFRDNCSPKNTWKSINKLLGRQKQSNKITVINTRDGVTTNLPEIVNEFNNHFAMAGHVMSETNVSTPKSHFNSQHTMFYNFHCIEDEFTDYTEVIRTIRQMKSGKAPGYDTISINFIKKHEGPMAVGISYLFNICMTEGVFPELLKTAKIIPVFKKGDKLEVNNYRPVSLLPCIGKILEKLLYTRVMKFLSKQEILSDNQYGFRPGSSTEIAATNMVNLFQDALDEGKVSAAIFIDLSKAFDAIDHNIMFEKLSLYGIRGQTLLIIKNYFHNRNQYTYIDGHESERKKLDIGVIQGGVLASLLFLIFINDISMLKLNGKMFIYADDTGITYDQIDLNKMQEDVDTLSQFFVNNNLSLNAEKTELIIIKSPYKTLEFEPNITVNNMSIRSTRNVKYLGLELDSSLSWTNHIERLSKEVAKSVGIIRKLRNRVNQKILHSIYNSLINSKLQYMLNIYGCATDTAMRRLFVLQNRAAKAIYKLPARFPTLDLYSKTAKHILPLKRIHQKKLILFVHQTINSTIQSTVTYNRVFSRRTRAEQSLKLIPPKFKTIKYGKSAIKYKSTLLYNEIPHCLKSDLRHTTFKRNLTEWLVRKVETMTE